MLYLNFSMPKMGNIQVSFNLTGRCNLSCTYCAARKEVEDLDYEDLSPEAIIKGYSKVREKHPEATLDLTCMGRGEPLLNWLGVLAIGGIREKDTNTRLLAITNGTFQVRNKVLELAKKEWILAVSYDGVMNELERKGAGHKVVEETIRELMKISPTKTIIKMTITPQSLPFLKESLIKLHDLGTKYVMLGPISPLGKYEGNHGLIEDSSKMSSLLENIVFAEEIGLKPLLSIQRACGLATSGYYVMPDGNLSICYLKQIEPTQENRIKAQEQGCLLYNLFK